ncbi:MAG: signal peptidase I [Peptococcaceae bacterium]|nr:signal peptidase I [Peptococcaceae bacterium]
MKEEKSSLRVIMEIVEIIVIAFALSWLLRTFVIEARYVPTGSMLTTIQLNDRLAVDKIFFKYVSDIKRKDIVVFKPPPEAHAQDDYIKRVIGLPGEKIEIIDHITYINDEPLDEPYVDEPAASNYGPVYVAQGCLFVMGDNRNDSADSRVWGLLPIENVTGRALFCYWPVSHVGRLRS